ncbi:hypothetical protein MKEN_01180100 [Mycena kentingensis (nom. inval.)]|nr:hypothetical protein MKEN_01180100 [Mycena kentingensis (nom. inval.)]
MATTLSLFWDLSSSSTNDRIAASVKLIGALEDFQKQAQIVAKPDDEQDADPVDVLNAQDVAYSLRRLIRGLASPRESSRLGFAVALTELLSRLDTVTSAQILALLNDSTKPQGSMTGQEERDLLFARLFGITAIIQSGLLVRSQPLRFSVSSETSASSLAAFQEALSILFALGDKKSWLRESAWWTVGLAIDALSASEVPWKDEALEYVVGAVFGENNALWSPEKLAITLKLQAILPERNWQESLCPPFKSCDLLCSANLLTVAKILKESAIDSDEQGASATGSWKPQLHFVWDALIERFLESTGSPNATKGTFPEFFRVVVDDSLFSSSSSQERKYTGFQVFQKALPRVNADNVGMLFTKNFMRSWINHLSHPDRYLHKIAKQVATDIQSIVKTQPRLGFALILELTGVNGSQQFDKLTKSKTVESILASMDAEGIKSYIEHVIEQANPSGDDQVDIPAINLRRAWIIDQLFTLIRNSVVPKDDACITLILDWLTVHGLFSIKKKSDKSPFQALRKVPAPPFSDALRQQCRDRLLSCLAELNGRLQPFKTADDNTVKYPGMTSDGEFWVAKVIKSIETLQNDSKHVELLSEIDEEDAAVYSSAKDTVDKLHALPQESAKGAQLLLLGMLLQHWVEDKPEVDTSALEDCVDASIRFFFSKKKSKEKKSKKNKKEKEADKADAQAEQPEPVDIFVDTIIGFLEKSTAFLRVVGNQVFALISSSLQASTIDLILSQLERKTPDELIHDEEDEEAEGEEIEDGDDADSESESEIEIDEESDDGEVDPELRRKIEEALRVNGVGVDSGEDGSEGESDEELMDDEQMLAVDEQLAQVFKMREGGKRGKNVDVQREATHFKNRVLDLVDTFLRKEGANPLVLRLLLPLVELSTGTSSDEGHLTDKAKGILRSRIAKSKTTPSVTNLDEAKSVIGELHTRARRLHSPDLLSTLSQCGLYLAKVLVDADQQETVVAAYRESLEDFVTRKNSALSQAFFSDAIRRFPDAFWDARKDVITLSKRALNGYRRLQTLQLLQTLLSRTPSPDKQADTLVLMRSFRKALVECITEASADKVVFTAAQMKDLLKLASFAMRQTYRIASEPEARKAWDHESWKALGESLAESTRFKSAVGLHKTCQQLATPPASANGTSKRKAETEDAASDLPPKKKKSKTRE